MSLSINTLKEATSIFERYVGSTDDLYVFSFFGDSIQIKLDRKPSKEDFKELEVLGWEFDEEFSKSEYVFRCYL